MPKATKKRSRTRTASRKNGLGLLVLAELFARSVAYRKELVFVLVAECALAAGIILSAPWLAAAADTKEVTDTHSTELVAQSLYVNYVLERAQVRSFEDAETTAGIRVADDAKVQNLVTAVEFDLEHLQYPKAHHDLDELKQRVSTWGNQLQAAISARDQARAAAARAAAVPLAPIAVNYLDVPILIYHHTPSDFERQLLALRNKGYTTIDLDQLSGALNKKLTLPAKPVVITLDDGFQDQMSAYTLLLKYRMKATFYIIDGGAASNWCIGAGRKYGLASQPPSGCGDQYLTWDELRQMDQSGLMTIGSHTVDHENLASLPSDQQWFQIEQGKLQLESELGHAVHHFAYPYGGYNATTLSLVAKAGFWTAVTTLPGVDQRYGSQESLLRVRSAYDLP